ncbi:MAG TPA: Rha family transcriptional regulator [Fusobacterium sp.]|uniref:Rha family transcriptional regulator n=1 Tax=Fusobacterium sp. TaxID=68766 RepID=UPI002F3F116A
MENILVKVENKDGILVVSSNRVAEELGVEHKNLLMKIDSYIEKFGGLTLSREFYIESIFENRGKQFRNYLITKKGIAQVIGGYSAAVSKAFEYNVAYINEFERMEQILRNRNSSEWLLTREQGKLIRRVETDAIQELIPYAKEQGSNHADMLYMTYSKLVNSLVGIKANTRDIIEFRKLIAIHQLEDMFSRIIENGIKNKMYYKEIYKLCKRNGQMLMGLLNGEIKALSVD